MKCSGEITVDKRAVYMGLMLCTLAYPLAALTIIVREENWYDDEGNLLSHPLPQVTCPIEGAEGDPDCAPSPLAYANLDSLIWVFVVNEFIMHFTYVLYVKLWATGGMILSFQREFLSIIAFLAPELTLNSVFYYVQTMPVVREWFPGLKHFNYPLLVSFFLGATVSMLYGVGTSQTTDQFRRTVTLAGPGLMFLFVDWFSRSVFLPFFELMQTTLTDLEVGNFVLAIFELILTNVYGSLFLPATQKLCVALARFFYNVSYRVDSKVTLYDYVNLQGNDPRLSPRDPMSKRTTLISPSDIGTFDPGLHHSSITIGRKRSSARTSVSAAAAEIQKLERERTTTVATVVYEETAVLELRNDPSLRATPPSFRSESSLQNGLEETLTVVETYAHLDSEQTAYQPGNLSRSASCTHRPASRETVEDLQTGERETQLVHPCSNTSQTEGDGEAQSVAKPLSDRNGDPHRRQVTSESSRNDEQFATELTPNRKDSFGSSEKKSESFVGSCCAREAEDDWASKASNSFTRLVAAATVDKDMANTVGMDGVNEGRMSGVKAAAETQRFRNNVYIPYRKGFGSDAVEFEKITTWFNLIWDSWRFLLLRAVMVKTSNVIIFFIMIFKDFIYSIWHFCVRYNESCMLFFLELRSVDTPKNRRILSILHWFQVIIVRPFLAPKSLTRVVWRSQLLFGLNKQRAESRMRSAACRAHSRVREIGIRTLSNINDNAPWDAENTGTPKKAIRGFGILLGNFWKELGHDIAAHFREEFKGMLQYFSDRAHNSRYVRPFRKRESSVKSTAEAEECDVEYHYATEVVIIRNVPVTVTEHSKRSSSLFSRSFHGSESGTESILSASDSHMPTRKKKRRSSTLKLGDIFRSRKDSAFRTMHAAWLSQVVEEVQSLIYNRTWPRLLQKFMSSISLVVSDVIAENTKVGLLPAYQTFGLFRTYDGRVRLFLMFAFDFIEVCTVYKVQTISRFYASLKDGFNNHHDGPLVMLCTINCAGILLYFGLLRYVRFANINGNKLVLPDNCQHEMLNQLNLEK
ncbi:putative transmembrane protein [Toxoplasma gondii GAB2-2007-GAL-DOM2]|uniref:Transmembrane protein n=5 Tax=Toxoplasma gondii TaxID=5811 RepID=S7UED1_TOXGG|nr:hypothetical protein TGGT1_243470 [Toxoplasma gondii GT1]KAF4643227.1 hypothetical protein TGRH88_028940 [Toxoplasma gondii]KFG33089.1 putative transmembrane protein [Toxoplasma gondii GAB2-2007-GAL-DOM2]KFG51428.1 putative transmembrane protein [Toxoplasma gondii FOU]RQX69118.1 putative transmembrane protein [Toxoplasma gondii CAST]